MYRELVKAKTAAKKITYGGGGGGNSDDLKTVVLDTVRKASQLVGSTLGPNGRVVLIERQESLPPFTTKDGITVFNSMAFANPTAQAVLEAARDSSSKTNVEAGDGTTTATILAEALIRLGFEYLEKNPKLSVQKVMREMERTFRDLVVPAIKSLSVKITEQNSDDLLRKVAMVATNNDEEMSDAVIRAFGTVGHGGNITIDEGPGASGYQVEKIEGLPIARGFEDSCGRFFEEFINDKANYRVILEKPHFILYNGKLNEPSALIPILQKVATATGLTGEEIRASKFSPNIIVVAHHFSEAVLAFMMNNFKNAEALNLFPLKTPLTQQTNSPFHFLHDLSAFTGAIVFDPVSRPLESAELEDLGVDEMRLFESYRYKSLLLGEPPEPILIARVEELEQQAKQPESELDGEIIRERMSLLTGGVARVRVLGSSESELKEKKHRVEDAVMAIKGALKEGVLPGCCKTLLVLSSAIAQNPTTSDAVKQIMARALAEPFSRIFTNGGATTDEIQAIYAKMMDVKNPFFYTYDALSGKTGDAIELGIVDSASAVLMAIKNSLAVAKMLMGLSGIVVFQRDLETEIDASRTFKAENQAMAEAIRDSNQEHWEPPI